MKQIVYDFFIEVLYYMVLPLVAVIVLFFGIVEINKKKGNV